MAMERIGDIELSQDLDYQRRSWIAQRVGWIFFGLLMVAAFAGFLGAGPFSAATAGEGTPLQVQYGRFVRHRAPVEMKIAVQPGAVQGEEARISVNREYLEQVEIQNVVPEPDSVETAGDRLTYVFKVANAGEVNKLTFNFMPITIGQHEVRVGLEGGPEHTFKQMIYP